MIKFILALVSLVLFTATAALSQSDGQDSYRKEGLELLQKGKFPEATKFFERLVESSPLSAVDHFMLGEALMAQGKFIEAAVELKQAHNIKPSESVYALRCAEAYSAAGKQDEAIAACESGLAQCRDEAFKKAFESLKASIRQPYVPPPAVNPEQPKRGGR